MLTLFLLVFIITVSASNVIWPYSISSFAISGSGPSPPSISANDDTDVHVCDEPIAQSASIYCYGKLLEAVNFHSLFNDSKTFVDMPMSLSPAETRQEFDRRFGNLSVSEIPRRDLSAFLDVYFTAPGTELERCTPVDWTESPKKLMRITDSQLRRWALDLNVIWISLCRKMRQDVHADRHSLIYVPHEFIVPGGRFREYYYWDAYWIVKGLIASGMLRTARGMILNFASVIDRYGFVPNGGRVYYLRRSQPPLLIPMVYEYFEETQDSDFVFQLLPTLIKEFDFWRNERTVTVQGQDKANYTVFQYRTVTNTPRPESFREDTAHAKNVPNNLKRKFYQDVASAAESGWDFSSRWFSDRHSIEKIETTSVAPIDLNAFLCWNMNILEYFFRVSGNEVKATKYHDMREDFRKAMQQVFFNETIGAWFDYNIRLKAHNTKFLAAVAVPLFAGCYQPLNWAKSENIIHFMNKSGAFDYPGGVPTSLANDSVEQWDFPNGWSPLNHMIIEGLRKSESPVAQKQAFDLAQKWIRGNYKVFKATGHMWEKYNVIGSVQKPGAGGEYAVQDGFGWTNGAILDLLSTYHDRMSLLPGADVVTSVEDPSDTFTKRSRNVPSHSDDSDGAAEFSSDRTTLLLFSLLCSMCIRNIC